jgi:hypothetical protein
VPGNDILNNLASQVASGKLRVPLFASRYELDEVPQAISDFAKGSLGKWAIRIASKGGRNGTRAVQHDALSDRG